MIHKCIKALRELISKKMTSNENQIFQTAAKGTNQKLYYIVGYDVIFRQKTCWTPFCK